MSQMTGGCLCGAVRCEAKGELPGMAICYCTDCQKQTGSAFLEVIVVPDDTIAVAGETRSYAKQGDSGRTLTRRFCLTCGTVVAMTSERLPNKTLIMGGTLDDTKSLRPRMALFCGSAQPWMQENPDIPRHPRMPT